MLKEKNVKLIVLLAVCAGAFSSIFVRFADDATPMAMGFYRLFFSVPFFAAATFKNHKTELMKVTSKDLMWCGLVGVFLALHFFTYFSAVQLTSVASAVLLYSSHPVIVVILSYLIFKTRTPGKALIGIATIIFGCIIISGGDFSFQGTALLGDFFALGSALFMAFYYIGGRALRPRIIAPVYIFLIFSSCFLTFLAGMIITATPFTGYSPNDWLSFLGLALVCHIGSHAVMNWSLKYVNPVFVSTAGSSEAIYATLLAILFFMEIPTAPQIIGGIIIMSGIFIYIRYEGSSIRKDDNIVL